MSRFVSLILVFGALGILGACGSGDNGDGGADCTVEQRATYPEGPYGTDPGEVMADLEFTTPDDTSLSLQELREVEGQNLLLLATGAGWCTACKEEQPTLEGWHDTYGSQGLTVMVAVNQDDYYYPAGAEEAADWITESQVTFTVVADTDFVIEPYFPGGDSTVQPLNLIVDLCDMTIIERRVGSDPSATEAVIEARL